MNARELFELASLDALGLLDEDERAEFESAFRSATPELQAQIRREQLRFSQIEDTLPNVEPPPGLRARVVLAVKEAMRSVASEPIARIGPNNAPWFSTATFWRAACIGFATATIVLGGFVFTVAQQNKVITQEALYNQFAGEVKDVGGTALVSALLAPRMQRVSFREVEQGVAGKANVSLFVDPDNRTALLLCRDLPIAAGEYTLVIGDSNQGERRRTHQFRARGGDLGVQVDNVTIEDLGSIQLHAPKDSNGKSRAIMVSDDM